MLEEFKVRKLQVEQEIGQLQSEDSALKNNYIKVDNFKRRLVSMRELFKGLDSHRQRELTASLIDDIILNQDGVEIRFFGTSAILSREDLSFFLNEFELRHRCGAI